MTAKRLLVIQPGEKLPTLARVRGDFADWVTGGMGISAAKTLVVHPHRGDPLPDPGTVDAAVITGSSAMVTDATAWITEGTRWLAGAVRSGLPVLGICFGHQWLGEALGGQVSDNPRGTEVGTVSVRFLPAARDDPLFHDLPAKLPLHVSHRQSVVVLPPGAVHLAASDLEPHQAFRWGRQAWGVQFHPEFSPDIVRGYLDYHAAGVEARGGNVETLRSGIVQNDCGRRILARFARLAGLVKG